MIISANGLAVALVLVMGLTFGAYLLGYWRGGKYAIEKLRETFESAAAQGKDPR